MVEGKLTTDQYLHKYATHMTGQYPQKKKVCDNCDNTPVIGSGFTQYDKYGNSYCIEWWAFIVRRDCA
jgi:hypothetical protein